MKSVLISIQPKWCELIASGKKTVEVRKTRPKIEPPFKCYIYCTNTKTMGDLILCKSKENADLFGYNSVKGINKGFAEIEDIQLKGKVIGEFICNGFTYIEAGYDTNGNRHLYNTAFIEHRMCTSDNELFEYLYKSREKCGGWAWHISDLVIYEQPKELSEFCILDNSAIQSCEHRKLTGQPEYKTAHNGWIKGGYLCNKSGELTWCEKCKIKPIKRPPQSWCYVEEANGHG